MSGNQYMNAKRSDFDIVINVEIQEGKYIASAVGFKRGRVKLKKVGSRRVMY